MKRLKILQIIFSLIFFISTANRGLNACTCGGESSFCEEIGDTSDLYINPEYVIRATKLQDINHGMLVKIENQYINEIEEEIIMVWGDPGHLCRYYTGIFDVGDQMILGINKFETAGEMEGEEAGSYWFPGCGVTYLKIADGKVEGQITPDIEKMDLSDFENFMYAQGYKTDCSSLDPEDFEELEEINIEVYPNPANELTGFYFSEDGYIQEFEIYNTIGQRLNTSYIRENKSLFLNVKNFSSGMYFARIRMRGKEHVLKFVVE